MNADALAPLYRAIEYAAFGRALERARCHFVDELAGARRILILGEGDGRFLSRLRSANPDAEVTVIDLSFEMLKLARARGSHAHFIQADGRALPLRAQSYDAIVTNFFLDCLSQAEADSLLPALAYQLTPGGLWLIGEFDRPASGWRRLHAVAWIFVMYRFFGLATGLKVRRIPTFRPLPGLSLNDRHESRWGLIVSELWRKPY